MERPAITVVDDTSDLATLYRDPSRRDHGRPWVMLNMISALDGAISYGGVSGPLGLSGDSRAFGVIRDLADVVLVGSGTVHAETYSPPTRTPETRDRRRTAGSDRPLRYAVVTNSARIDVDKPTFADADPDARPILVTGQLAADRHAELSRHADIIETGGARVDLPTAIRLLGETGVEVVLAEGGPTLNGALHDEDLIDELFLTVSPHLVGGSGSGILNDTDGEHLRRFDLIHAAATEDSEILTRWRRRR